MVVSSVVNSRRGSTLVESAIILPFVIFSLIAIVFMMITQFELTAEMSYFHTALRTESGVISNTFNNTPSSTLLITPEAKKSLGYEVIEDELTIKRNNFVFLGDYKRKIKSKAYCINEEDIIRGVSRWTKKE